MIYIRKIKIVLKKFELVAGDIKVYNNEKVIISSSNNSGKSIFLLGVTGLIRSIVRDVFFDGTHCNRNLWQQYTGVYHDQSSLVPFLTPSEYFKMIGELRGIPKGLVALNTKKFCDYLNFPTGESKYISELSSGTQKKVGLIASLLGNPSIVLWDEPFTNLDDRSCFSLASLIEEELRNTTVVLAAPNNDFPFRKFTSRLFIDDGVVYKAPTAD